MSNIDLEKHSFSGKELEELRKEHKISPPPCQDIKTYNDMGKYIEKLVKSRGIIDALWAEALLQSAVQFECTHPEYFPFEEEEQKDIDEPQYYQGQRVEFKYPKANDNNGEATIEEK
jgi:hypothetical protein